MRGEAERPARLMLGLTPDGFVPTEHPLRRIKLLVDSVLRRMSPLFDELDAAGGRSSLPPEHLLKSNLFLAFYTVRSERQFCEQLRYNLLFKWFLDLNVEEEPFHPTNSRSTAHCSNPGPGTRATGRSTSRMSGAARLTSRPPTRRPGFTVVARNRRPGSAISAIC